jgi:hypothetical protein
MIYPAASALGSIGNNFIFHNIIFYRIRSDHNVDSSADIMQQWIRRVRHQYKSINFKDDNSSSCELSLYSGCNEFNDIQFACYMMFNAKENTASALMFFIPFSLAAKIAKLLCMHDVTIHIWYFIN